MAKTRVEIHPEGLDELLQEPGIRSLFMDLGAEVQANAEATASDAEKGDGGRISGYAAAGFTTQYVTESGRRPRVIIKSNADMETFMRTHFSTQKRWGVAHLRQALYKITKRGG